jgi:hypothetical protein
MGEKLHVFHDVHVPITSSRNQFVMLKPQRHRGHGGTTKYEIRNAKFEKNIEPRMDADIRG